LLENSAFSIALCHTEVDFLQEIEQGLHHIDCLVLEETPKLLRLTQTLCRQATLLPAVILRQTDEEAERSPLNDHLPLYYHTAEVQIATSQANQIVYTINQAIAQFLQLAPVCILPGQVSSLHNDDRNPQEVIARQQQRLSDKLKERLGYLGVYYKRDSQRFLRHISTEDRQDLLQDLKQTYRYILLHYFSQSADLNQKIDIFVNTAFFADLPVTQIVEIHMELMGEFAKQLKLEGRGEEILLDYRLTLIDIIAHLCEMYRRSIPREA
jgi:circadian clock protein KaiA